MQVPEKAQEFIDSLMNQRAACEETIAGLRQRIAACQVTQLTIEQRIKDAEKLVDLFKEAVVPADRSPSEQIDIIPPFPARAEEWLSDASEDVDQAELTARERIRAAALEARGRTVDIARRAGVSRSHAASELSELARAGVVAHDGIEWGDPEAFS